MTAKKPASPGATGERAKPENFRCSHLTETYTFHQLWGWYVDGALGARDPEARRLSSIAERRRCSNGTPDELADLRAIVDQLRRDALERSRSEPIADEPAPMSGPTVEVPKRVRGRVVQ